MVPFFPGLGYFILASLEESVTLTTPMTFSHLGIPKYLFGSRLSLVFRSLAWALPSVALPSPHQTLSLFFWDKARLTECRPFFLNLSPSCFPPEFVSGAWCVDRRSLAISFRIRRRPSGRTFLSHLFCHDFPLYAPRPSRFLTRSLSPALGTSRSFSLSQVRDLILLARLLDVFPPPTSSGWK